MISYNPEQQKITVHPLIGRSILFIGRCILIAPFVGIFYLASQGIDEDNAGMILILLIIGGIFLYGAVNPSPSHTLEVRKDITDICTHGKRLYSVQIKKRLISWVKFLCAFFIILYAEIWMVVTYFRHPTPPTNITKHTTSPEEPSILDILAFLWPFIVVYILLSPNKVYIHQKGIYTGEHLIYFQDIERFDTSRWNWILYARDGKVYKIPCVFTFNGNAQDISPSGCIPRKADKIAQEYFAQSQHHNDSHPKETPHDVPQPFREIPQK